MKELLKNSEGRPTHKHLVDKIYIHVEDWTTWLSHEITTEEVANYFGDDGRDELHDNMRKIASLEYSSIDLRIDILTYNEVFKHRLVRDIDHWEWLAKQIEDNTKNGKITQDILKYESDTSVEKVWKNFEQLSGGLTRGHFY